MVDTKPIPWYNNSIVRRKQEQNMTEFEVGCYGISEQQIRDEYINSFTAKRCGIEMVVMSILSDAQEVLTFNTEVGKEQSRKLMNIAKYILSEMMEAKRV